MRTSRMLTRSVLVGVLLGMLAGPVTPVLQSAASSNSQQPLLPAAAQGDQISAAATVAYYLPWEFGIRWKINADRTAGNHVDEYNAEAFDASPIVGEGPESVAAAARGTVFSYVSTYVGNTYPNGRRDTGNCVVLKHADNTYTQYAHLSSVSTAVIQANGAEIPAGTILGEHGNTGYSGGPHLHFSRLKNVTGVCVGDSIAIQFSDPDPALQQSGGVPKTNQHLSSFNMIPISPGPANPSFKGGKVPITGSTASHNSSSAKNVYDGNGSSNWHSGHITPSSASLRLDLGGPKSISGIKWKFSYLGFADSFKVLLVAANGTVLKTYGPYGNGTATQTWYGVSVGETLYATSVRFEFTNPILDSAVGSIGEVEVWQKPKGATGVQSPAFGGGKLTVVNSASTPNTGTANVAIDGIRGTNWAVQGWPATASLRFDLGRNMLLSGVKWNVVYPGYTDDFMVRLIATDSYLPVPMSPVQEFGPFTNPTQALTFFGIAFPKGVVARYVQFHFVNPSLDMAIGSIGEVEIWGSDNYWPGYPNHVPDGDVLPIVSSASTPNTGTSRSAHDGKTWTNWHSGFVTPSTATLRFDLGKDMHIDGVTWTFSSLGFADKFWVRLVDSRGQYIHTFGPHGNATATGTFFGFSPALDPTTRYVDFIFENPQNDVALGSVGEVRIYGAPLAGYGASADLLSATETSFAGAIIPANQEVASDSFSAQANGTGRDTFPVETVLYDLETVQELTGVRWKSNQAVAVGLAWSADGATWIEVGNFASLAMPGAWQGTNRIAGNEARYVRVTYQSRQAGQAPPTATTLEIWGIGEAPIAASPIPATPMPVGATPEASPAPAIPEPVDASPIAPEETPATPVATAEPTDGPAVEPTTELNEGTPVIPIVTEEPAVEPTAEPTAAISVGTITGTDGDAVNCRVSAPDGDPITKLSEGDAVAVTGTAVDGWLPVICDGQPGFIADQFVTMGSVTPTESADPSMTATSTSEGEPTEASTATAEVTEEATATTEPTTTDEPTEEPEETPYPVVDTGDTENSGTAWLASDNDASTYWSVYPSQSPEQTRLYFDLGSVLPIDRLTIELAQEGMLPYFEIWLSEDGETWYNATPNGINGWDLWADEAHVFNLGYDARYLRIVIPDIDESGLIEVGGIRQVEIWAGDINGTQYLTALGNPTTPTPVPTVEEPTVESTEEIVEDPTEEVILTEEPVTNDEIPDEETPPGDEEVNPEVDPDDEDARG